MALRKYLNYVIKHRHKPHSVIDLAKAECLPPMLHITTIALLMYPDSEELQKDIEFSLKRLINQKKLPVITVEEFSKLIIEHDSKIDIPDFLVPPPPGYLPAIGGMGVMHSDEDELEEDNILNSEKRRIYVVERNDMKRFLESENDWPLPESNLLSRWWPEKLDHNQIVEEDNIPPAHEDNYFRLEKDYWRTRYQGESRTIKQSLGMKYITVLMQRAYDDQPEIHVAELFYLVKGRPAAENTVLSNLPKEQLEKMGLNINDFEKGLDLANPEGKKWLLKQKQDLIKEINQAEDFGNVKEAENLKEKLENLDTFLKKVFSLSGRMRKSSDPNEKVRKSVSKTIYKALERMGLKDGDNLALYLNDHLSKGLFCSFRKDTNISWKIIKK
jgi:hypothetical protein